MNTCPQFFLRTRTGCNEPGEWHFVLQTADHQTVMDVRDTEPDLRGERLELLTVVRGLEALDQPSKVDVFTSSRYVRHGIEYGIPQWRRDGWTWESFGQMTPIKNADLWQRLERALRIHVVTVPAFNPRFRIASGDRLRVDAAQRGVPSPTSRRAHSRIGGPVRSVVGSK